MPAHAHATPVERLPYVVALLGRVAGAHRRRNAKLGALCDAGEELADALEGPADARERPVALLLARVRWLADDFAVPAWGDRAYQALMEELAALEADVRARLDVAGPTLRAA
jgi:hypothetical protein